jgi:hypothetical protein
MKRLSIYGILVVSLLLSAPFAKAQDKVPAKEEPKAVTVHESGPQLKVQIVFSEYEGEKKTKTLPYTLVVLPGDDIKFANWSKLRIGDRVPVAEGNEGGTTQFQYIDVGTNIDCRASSAGTGRFQLALNLERSWVQAENPDAESKKSVSIVKQYNMPTIRQFRSESSLNLIDGQKIESTFATDPITGKVTKLEITMNVVK